MWPEAELDVFEEAEQLYKITLENVAISNWSISRGAGGIPEESFSCDFSKITWQFRDEADQNWDCVANKGSVDK